MNTLVKIGMGVFAFVIFASMVSQCGGRRQVTNIPTSSQSSQTESVETILKQKAEGLDLKAVTELAKKCKDASDFEARLNAQSEAVNNLDLNEDGKVDYINVTEYGSGNLRGFSLTTELSPGKAQEIATIEFEKDEQAAKVQTTGNSALYGPGYYQHSSFGLTDALLMGWLFSNRGGSYQSPYGYGNYPPTYGGGWSTRDRYDYDRSMTSRTTGSTLSRSSGSVLSKSVTSPNADKMEAKARALSNPTQSQRSFGSRSSGSTSASQGTSSNRPSGSSASTPSRPTSSPSSSSSSRSGGFGRSSSSGSSRSGSSFGGGK